MDIPREAPPPRIFIPFSEALLEALGMDLASLEARDLVPFDLDYQCLRVGERFADVEADAADRRREAQLP